MTTTHRTAADIENNIAAIRSAAFGMGHPLNAGQALRVAALELELAQARRDEARHAFENAKTAKARRDADEELTFWIGRVTALELNANKA